MMSPARRTTITRQMIKVNAKTEAAEKSIQKAKRLGVINDWACVKMLSKIDKQHEKLGDALIGIRGFDEHGQIIYQTPDTKEIKKARSEFHEVVKDSRDLGRISTTIVE